MPAKKPRTVVLPALPSAVFAEREYLLTAWGRYVGPGIVERLNIVAFDKWEYDTQSLQPSPISHVRMRWSDEPLVGRDVVVPRHLLERTDLYQSTTGEFRRADLEGVASILALGPLTTGPVEILNHVVRTQRVLCKPIPRPSVSRNRR